MADTINAAGERNRKGAKSLRGRTTIRAPVPAVSAAIPRSQTFAQDRIVGQFLTDFATPGETEGHEPGETLVQRFYGEV